MKVPFLDLARGNEPHTEEFVSIFKNSLQKSAFVGGESVSNFEKDFAEFCGTQYCIGVSSGTSAINLPLEAAGIGAGDEVIVPANTFIATAAGVVHAGAKPVFCDIDPLTHNIDPVKAKQAITSKTKAIIGVHLYGRLCDVDALQKVCDEAKISFFEDSAQAHGATWKGKRAGTFGRAAFFSFYPGKNLGALGDAGAVVTNDSEISRKTKLLREHGSSVKYQHEIVGYNHRIHAIQAAFLQVKLRELHQKNQQRMNIAKAYYEAFSSMSSKFQMPSMSEAGTNVFHLFPIFTSENQKLAAFLLDKGVATGYHYPKPCHLQEAFKHLGYQAGAFPHAEKSSFEELSLPIFPEMTPAEVQHVIQSVKEFYA